MPPLERKALLPLIGGAVILLIVMGMWLLAMPVG